MKTEDVLRLCRMILSLVSLFLATAAHLAGNMEEATFCLLLAIFFRIQTGREQ